MRALTIVMICLLTSQVGAEERWATLPSRLVWFEALEMATGGEAENIRTLMIYNADVWGAGDFTNIGDLVAPNYIRHQSNGTSMVTREAYAANIERARLSGLSISVQEISASGDLVWTRWMGHMPDQITGYLQVYRFEDGRIAETWIARNRGVPWPD